MTADYFCATANVEVPLKLLFTRKVVTLLGIVPWKEYLAPPPLRPLLVMVPMNAPLLAS